MSERKKKHKSIRVIWGVGRGGRVKGEGERRGWRIRRAFSSRRASEHFLWTSVGCTAMKRNWGSGKGREAERKWARMAWIKG
jgi:hypothetical protein